MSGKKPKNNSTYSDVTYQRNKERRITKHLLQNPKDLVAERALENPQSWKKKKKAN